MSQQQYQDTLSTAYPSEGSSDNKYGKGDANDITATVLESEHDPHASVHTEVHR